MRWGRVGVVGGDGVGVRWGRVGGVVGGRGSSTSLAL